MESSSVRLTLVSTPMHTKASCEHNADPNEMKDGMLQNCSLRAPHEKQTLKMCSNRTNAEKTAYLPPVLTATVGMPRKMHNRSEVQAAACFRVPAFHNPSLFCSSIIVPCLAVETVYWPSTQACTVRTRWAQRQPTVYEACA